MFAPALRIVLRPTRPTDEPALSRLARACFEGPQVWSGYQMRAALEQGGGIIALSGDQAVGLALWHLEPRAEIVNLAVAPRLRRKGIGKALVERALRTLARLDPPEGVWLCVEGDNAAALALYGACGFESTGTRDDYYGPGRHAVEMRWKGAPGRAGR